MKNNLHNTPVILVEKKETCQTCAERQLKKVRNAELGTPTHRQLVKSSLVRIKEIQECCSFILTHKRSFRNYLLAVRYSYLTDERLITQYAWYDSRDMMTQKRATGTYDVA